MIAPDAPRSRRFGFRSGGLSMEGETIVPERARVLAVLCHGIPSGRPPDPDDRGYPALARDLAARGLAAAWMSFRGAKGAPGDFSIRAWADDLESALDAMSLDPRLASLARVPVGSSAGGAVAIAVGARRADVEAVAALACPAAFDWEASGGDPRRWLLELRNIGIVRDPAFPPDFDSWCGEFADAAPETRVGAISPRPLLLVHGDADDVVPYPHAERLFVAAGEPKELVRIPGGRHQLRRDPRAVDALADWLANLPL
ncbi:MAG: alpha/beta hydrolase [Acidobacteria bacterium]|nr:alpha/beta hydrolase [Acidobacteriota bacterium]